jgi:hypothetical protein
MKRTKTCMVWFANVIVWITIQTLAGITPAKGEEQKITSGKCTALEMSNIPVGDFNSPRPMPQVPLRIEQKYNTSYKEGYNYGGVRYYGHDGFDTEGESETAGVNDVRSMLDGIVILSKSKYQTGGWGESIIIATRANLYSTQIITTHFHHMHSSGASATYKTTRRFNACDQVKAGDVIGKEGTTGKSTGSHLHLGIRRWKNLAELEKAIQSEGTALFGYGYVFNQTQKLAKNLDPQGFLYDTYLDYVLVNGQEPAYIWSLPYARDIRDKGIEFGLYDGRFGAGELVTRRESARWIKIAVKRSGSYPNTATFDDVSVDDPDFPYIETLLEYPSNLPTLNKNHTCKEGGKFFCPDDHVKRVEALKMIVSAFYGKEYLQMYEDSIWNNPYNNAMLILSQFADVDPLSWYASYVLFGVQWGFVAFNEYFNPGNPVTKEEMAKWVMLGYEHKNQAANDQCASTACPLDYYCDQTGSCSQIPTCVPSETMECELGGGYDQCADPICQAGSYVQQYCGNGGIQTSVCNEQCKWGPWSDCESSGPCTPGETQSCGNCGTMTCQSNSQWSTCQGQGVCTPGDTISQTCNGTGTQTKTCNTSCTWGSWSNCSGNCVCSSGDCCDGCNYRSTSYQCDLWNEYQCEGPNPGQNVETRQVKQYCSGSSQNCTGQVVEYGWQTHDNCSSSETCEVINGTPQCVPDSTCQDVYLTSTPQPCYNNPQSAGSPTLCLQLQQIYGPSWEYRICKQGNDFEDTFSYHIEDTNHTVIFTQYIGASGSPCTAWQGFSVAYIPDYGLSNGAGIIAKISSPQGCTQSSCQYRTGSITIRKECQ